MQQPPVRGGVAVGGGATPSYKAGLLLGEGHSNLVYKATRLRRRRRRRKEEEEEEEEEGFFCERSSRSAERN